MATMSAAFTATGNGSPIGFKNGDSFTYAVTGTFVGTVVLEKSTNGGISWATVATSTTTTTGTVYIVNVGGGLQELYRWRCSAYTSGTATCTIVDVETQADVVRASETLWEDGEGTDLFKITGSGIEAENVVVNGAMTFGSAGTFALDDDAFQVTDGTDATKVVKLECSGITTATTRTMTIPNESTTLVGTGATQTLTNKTITSPDINGGTADALTSLSIRDTSAAFDVTIAATSSVVLDAARTLTIDMVNAAKTLKIGGNITTAAAFITAGAYSLTLTTTNTTDVTLPTTGTLATLAGAETFTNKILTTPDINGGTADSLTSLSVRDTSAAYDVTIAAVSSVALTGGRTLTLDMINAARSIKLAGNVDLAGDLATVGAYALTLTQTAATNVTLPTTGTLATLAGSETLSSKILTAPDINGGTADSLTSLSIRDTSAAFDVTIAATSSVVLDAGRTLAIDVINAAKTLKIGGNITTAGAFITAGAYSLTLTTTNTTDVTLPTTGTLATLAGAETLSGKILTTPDINGGTADSLTSLSIRDTSAAFDVTIACTSSVVLDAGRILTIDMVNAAKTLKFGGNLTTAGAFITAGAYSLTLTTTNTTDVTLPTTGTLATLAGAETLSGKILTTPDINGGTADSLTSLSIRDTSAAFDVTITCTSSVVLDAGRTLTIDMVNAAKTIKLGGSITTAGAFLTAGAYSCTLTCTNTTDVTLPTTGTLATLAGAETLSGKILTTPDINGGTADSLTSLSIRDTSAAYDVTVTCTSSTALTAGRVLTLDMVNAARSVKLAGNIDIAGNLTTAGAVTFSGAYGATFTLTNTTAVTFPTSGTLATTAASCGSTWYSNDLDSPNTADWAVNALAPAAADTNNSGLTVRLFDAATEEGVGFYSDTPTGSASVTFSMKSRAETTPAGTVTAGWKLYYRNVADNGAVGAWNSKVLADTSYTTNEYFQYDTQALAFTDFSPALSAANAYQFELTRVDPGAGSELVGDAAVLSVGLKYS